MFVDGHGREGREVGRGRRLCSQLLGRRRALVLMASPLGGIRWKGHECRIVEDVSIRIGWLDCGE